MNYSHNLQKLCALGSETVINFAIWNYFKMQYSTLDQGSKSFWHKAALLTHGHYWLTKLQRRVPNAAFHVCLNCPSLRWRSGVIWRGFEPPWLPSPKLCSISVFSFVWWDILCVFSFIATGQWPWFRQTLGAIAWIQFVPGKAHSEIQLPMSWSSGGRI